MQLVMTVIGPDRPGLVSALSHTIADNGGNWLDARLASLAGHFAGVVAIEVPEARADALAASLQALQSQGLRVLVERSAPAGVVASGRTLHLALVGQDRPGIVREISRALAQAGVSIDELETAQRSSAFAGEAMFEARARLRLPEAMDPETLRGALESLADELMVDLDLDTPDGTY